MQYVYNIGYSRPILFFCMTDLPRIPWPDARNTELTSEDTSYYFFFKKKKKKKTDTAIQVAHGIEPVTTKVQYFMIDNIGYCPPLAGYWQLLILFFL